MALDDFAPDVDLTQELPEDEVPAQQEEKEVTLDVPTEQKEQKIEEKPDDAHQKQTETHQKMVPVENVAAVKAQAREWRQKAEQVEREAAERFKKLEARLEALANPPPPVPDFQTDPAGNLKHQLDTTRAELDQIRQVTEQSRQSQEAQAFEARVASDTQMAEAVFAKDHPDYLNAVSHLQAIADKNLQLMGVDDPIARQAQIRKDALAMSLKALQMGKSPAEVAYQLAQNYGYTPVVAQTQQGNGVAKPDAAKKIEQLQAGQKAGAMPSGGTKQQTLTLAALEQMDDDEFNRLVEDDASWKKLVRQMS